MSAADLYLSPSQRNLLQAAFDSNKHPSARSASASASALASAAASTAAQITNPPSASMSDRTAPGSGHLDHSDDSPYLDFGLDGEVDESFQYDDEGRMIGDLPDDSPPAGDLHDKRKSIGDQDDDDEEGGGKRREGDDKGARKPGRKPLMSEPTSKRKAQNRAAQRAFRERKEKHLKDLETKVEELEKVSESKDHQNGLLKAQVERLQIELREYRKRLSWITSSSNRGSPTAAASAGRNSLGGGNDFQFEFPKFGDLPSANFKTPSVQNYNAPARAAQSPVNGSPNYPATSPAGGAGPRQSASSVASLPRGSRSGSAANSPINSVFTASPAPVTSYLPATNKHNGSFDSLSGLFSPSILQTTSRHNSLSYFPDTTTTSIQSPVANNNNNTTTTTINNNNNNNNVTKTSAAAPTGRSSLDMASVPALVSSSSHSNTDSPASSAESQQHSSIGTSPEPLFNSPGNNRHDFNLAAIDENSSMTNLFAGSKGLDDFSTAGIDWLAQQNGGSFDPVLFGDYRETQDNVLSQDFGSFFNEAYPLPDLGSPTHNFGDLAGPVPDVTSKPDLMTQVDAVQDRETVPAGRTNMLTCNKIWDRLQSMEKFRNGEIDIDNLCSELRAKAKCSEGGAVVDAHHVDQLLRRH